MLTVKQLAVKWGVSACRIRQFLAEGRIPGAVKLGRDWVIPKEAKFPTYLRLWKPRAT